MFRSSLWLVPALFLSASLVDGASAQTVLVEVTAAESGAPLAGVFVSVLDAEGNVLRSALTDGAGRVRLSSPGAQVRVSAELVGRESHTTETLLLGPGETRRLSVSLRQHAIRLDAIRVEESARCSLRPAEAMQIGDAWEAARQALSIQAWSDRNALYQLQISTYERDLDAQGRRVERESRRGTTRATRTPFAALPAERLLEHGFIEPDAEGGYLYSAPDAALLLSDEFLGTHCFRLTRSPEEPGGLGLAFEPVKRDVPGISGTLWLDEATAQLRHLDYRYTWAPYPEADGVAGGRVEFAAMPDGGWIIERWWIRAPIVARQSNMARAGDSGIRVTGVRETGGEVLGATPRSTLAGARGSIGGLVWDSTRVRALDGAAVSLSGTEYATTTDNNGRFVLGGVPAGIYSAVFAHPRLDTLGIDLPAKEVEVTAGRAVQLELAVPSSTSILLATCSASGASAEDGVVIGRVTDRGRGTPVPGATVRLEWQTVSAVSSALRATNEWLEVQTDADGRYTACGIPVRAAVHVRAKMLAYESPAEKIELARPDHRAVNLALDLPSNAGAPIMPRRESGLQGIQSIISEHGSGAHINGAEVTIRTVSGEVVASGLTNVDGTARFTMPTPGRYLLSVNALGYRELAGQPVEVGRGGLAVLEIQLTPQALALEPVVATAESRSFHLDVEGFYRRRSDGAGFFLDPERLNQRRSQWISNSLMGVPGIRVIESSNGDRGNVVMLTRNENCWPMVFVDRHLVTAGGVGGEPLAVDELVSAADIVAVEVYRTPSEIPSEFNGPNAGCGVIVLWTGRGGG